MKHIIDSDNYEIIVKNLSQAQSLAYILGSEAEEDKDKSNVFWIIQDLVNYAKKLVQDAEKTA
ncbi:hypothetical protein [Gilliamella sp. Pas-s25]|uniref:hypothetical protein n=1 Tax=Gilliamella sp. Pas-s25 TaxID=2687310 RepID=UPI00135F107F|nr:hypothetical protein [Gilliamella sp. Pas-s25]MWP63277.1 hypothetical protein [Gilliamella sp. Pas-s25]